MELLTSGQFFHNPLPLHEMFSPNCYVTKLFPSSKSQMKHVIHRTPLFLYSTVFLSPAKELSGIDLAMVYSMRSESKACSHVPYNGVSINDRLCIQQWSHKIITELENSSCLVIS